MDTDPLFLEAKLILSEATNLDRNERPNDALQKYKLGVVKLVEYMRTLSAGDPQKEIFGRKVDEYLSRAEKLKKDVQYEVISLEQRKIAANSTGHSYESVFAKCLNDKLTAVDVQDAYIVARHQILNFVRFCEMLVRSAKNIQLIELKTGKDAQSNQAAFNELANSLRSRGIHLTVTFEPNLHDREIKFDNGWVVKIGRGLDYFKKQGAYAIGVCDMNLRMCHETTIDIFKVKQKV